jgi:hypothetical protein
MGNILTIGVIITAIVLMVGFITGQSWLAWGLGILNIVFGPVCLILYLIEIKKGVFKDDGADA